MRDTAVDCVYFHILPFTTASRKQMDQHWKRVRAEAASIREEFDEYKEEVFLQKVCAERRRLQEKRKREEQQPAPLCERMSVWKAYLTRVV